MSSKRYSKEIKIGVVKQTIKGGYAVVDVVQ